MENIVYEDALAKVINTTKSLLTLNEIDEAVKLLETYVSPISTDLATTLLMNIADLNSLKEQKRKRTITAEDARVERAQIRLNLIDIMEQDVPRELEVQRMLGKLKTDTYKVPDDMNLEKILGTANHMVKINWLQKGIKASQCVCQVLRSDGERGTGFLLKGGYIMTNFHVIPNEKQASSAKIIFDYEEDLYGNLRKTSEFFLEPDDFKYSPIDQLDYAYIKVKDNPENPIAQWGHLEVDNFSDPQIDNPVTIIQHPSGQTKQIALTANKIIGINGPKLLYMTDTERGSSGAPVFNNDWKVVALHHAGKKEQDGGLVINGKTGERRGANEGILIKYIAEQLGLKN